MKQLKLLMLLCVLMPSFAFAKRVIDDPYLVIKTEDGKKYHYWVDLADSLYFEWDTIRQANRRYENDTFDVAACLSAVEYVDMGTDCYWAKYNLGAENELEIGYKYKWGMVDTSSVSDWSDYLCSYSDCDKMDRDPIYGYSSIAGTEFDAATHVLGKGWTMPSYDQCEALYKVCDQKRDTINDVPGWTFVSKETGNSLFFADNVRLWISYTGSNGYSYTMKYDSYYKKYKCGYESRKYCYPIRPVCAKSGIVKRESVLVEDSTKMLKVAYPYEEFYDCPESFKYFNVGEVTFESVENASVKNIQEPIEDVNYVDLGLESGTLWATSNLSVSNDSISDDMFIWGHTFPYKAEKYVSYDYARFAPAVYVERFKDDSLSMDVLRTKGIIDANGNLTPDYDAATQIWGDDWRMPTIEEFDELFANCKLEYDETNEVNKMIGPNGKYIIFSNGGYISSYFKSQNPGDYRLDYYGGFYRGDNPLKNEPAYVRPVLVKKK